MIGRILHVQHLQSFKAMHELEGIFLKWGLWAAGIAGVSVDHEHIWDWYEDKGEELHLETIRVVVEFNNLQGNKMRYALMTLAKSYDRDRVLSELTERIQGWLHSTPSTFRG